MRLELPVGWEATALRRLKPKMKEAIVAYGDAQADSAAHGCATHGCATLRDPLLLAQPCSVNRQKVRAFAWGDSISLLLALGRW